jgi:DNA-binding MarR family transcriptional regulator
VTRSRHGVTSPTGGSPHGRLRRRRPGGRAGGAATSETARAALDSVLELVGRRRLSATELRVLLRLVDRAAGISELAESLGQQPVEVRRAVRQLAGRGLVRWRHVGRRKRTRLDITPAGLAMVRALLTAAGKPPM